VEGKMTTQLKILFACDVHGSTTCFKKYLSALQVYKADIGILSGDLCGKFVVPIVLRSDGSYECTYMGERIVTKNEERMKEIERKFETMGAYYAYLTEEDLKELLEEGKTIEGRIDEKVKGVTLSSGKTEKLFEEKVVERLCKWLDYANDYLKRIGRRIYITPGNDDLLIIDDIIKRYASEHIIFADLTVNDIGGYEMASLSWSNPTPWGTPRETNEDHLRKMISDLLQKVTNMETAIFQFHVPPKDTLIDQAPKLDEKLRPSVDHTVGVGSIAVREAIERYQPLLGLHGHIHESRGVQKLGRTYILNPGSEYTEGILKGVMVVLENGRFKAYQFTSG
jgi:Icc-related predicted phosphoesterase